MRNNQTKCFIFNELIKWTPCITSWVIICQKVHYKGDTFKIPFIIKDLQQYLKYIKKDELLCEAVEKEVINVAKYYYYGTVYISG